MKNSGMVGWISDGFFKKCSTLEISCVLQAFVRHTINNSWLCNHEHCFHNQSDQGKSSVLKLVVGQAKLEPVSKKQQEICYSAHKSWSFIFRSPHCWHLAALSPAKSTAEPPKGCRRPGTLVWLETWGKRADENSFCSSIPQKVKQKIKHSSGVDNLTWRWWYILSNYCD